MKHSLEELFSLKGKVAIVTGGAGHLGSPMSYALAELGAEVIIASRGEKKCQRFAAKLNDDLGKELAVGHSLDVTDMDSINNLVKFIKDRYGKLDILVNNAYSGKGNKFEKITDEEWYSGIEGSLNSVFKMSKAFFPLLKESGGNIVNISSMYGHVAPDPSLYEGHEDFLNPPNYGAGKAGTIQLTRYMASFLAKYNIRVNAISPGPFPNGAPLEDKGFVENLCAKNPLNKIGEPYELKGTIALLCSEASSYITGQNICVDGGWTIW